MKQSYCWNTKFVFRYAKILALSLACFSEAFYAQAQEKYFHYSPDGKSYFTMSDSRIFVQFNKGIEPSVEAKILSQEPLLAPINDKMRIPAPKGVMAELSKQASEKDILALIARLNKVREIAFANPFLVYRDGTQQAALDRFAVKLKSQEDYRNLVELVKANGATMDEQYKYDPLVYFVRVSKSSKGNALELANQFAETKLFAYSEPDMLRLMKRFNTNDTFLNNQWSLNNTGSSIQFNGTVGADMRVFSAWGITTGSSSIKVAVIDEGVDLAHPDLAANLLPGFDGTGLGSNGGPSGNDAHGTACAGIIAAAGNNNQGIAGVAYSCKIIPVRIAYSSGANWVTTNAQIGTSIDWSWNNAAADVLSNSWGGGSSSSLINDPITRAATQGRGGLGAPVLFAAGNDNGANSYPATLTNVVSVVAMSMCNQRKSPTSCDGETFWGSNFGTGVDVAAPGVKIYTTDISGSAGYSTGNYTATFNGTSSATPNTAGVVALMLSANPGLTYAQARQILESTCEKVGGYTYNSGVSGQPNGSWSTDLGHGRVNAFAALQLVNPQPCTSPPAVGTASASPSSLCVTGNVSLSLTGVLFGTGQTYQWQSSPNNSTWTNISGATGQSAVVSASATTWYRCNVTCGGNTTASTSTQVTFNNATISTFPSTQNFDGSSSLPCGWTVQDVNGDAKTWAIGTTNSRSTTNNVTYSYSPTNAANDWLFSAPLQLVAGTSYRVRFWYRVRSATFPESMEVRFGSAANAASMGATTVFSATNFTNTTYVEGITSPISPTTSGIYYVGFKATSVANMYDINLDDITFEVAAACTTPPVAGTASGPATLQAGVAGSFVLTGSSGTSIQWQSSTNGGTSYTDIAGATAANASFTLPTGTVLVRARVSRTNCSDVFSNAISVSVSAPLGDVLSNPIQASLPYTTSISNAPGSGFSNAYTGTNNQASPDIFFRFTTGPCTDSIRISSCGSGFDTYVHLLNSSGTNITSNDDNGPLCTGTAGSLKFLVSPNTVYFAVFEGYSTNTGTISVSISQVDNPVFTTTISAGGPLTFCAGGSVLLTATSGASFLWSNGATTQSINATSSGSYSVTVTNPNGCSATSAATNVTVNPLPSVTVANLSTCEGTAVNLVGLPAGGTFSLPNPYSGPNSQYIYSLTDANGCTGSDVGTVAVNPLPSIFSLSGNGVYCSSPGTGGSATLSGSETGVNYGFNFTAGGNVATLAGTGSSLTLNNLTGAGTLFVVATNATTGCSRNMSGSVSVMEQAASTYYQDQDNDGFGNASNPVLACSQPVGYVTDNTDCDDNAGTVYPGATEVCGNLIDDDCDGLTDEGCVVYTFYEDSDNDTYGNPAASTTSNNPTVPSGYVTNSLDCNDNDPSVNPAATEICNGIDDNCDGFTDNGIPALGAVTVISGPAGVCRNATGQVFSVTPVPGATSYIWTLPSGATGSSSTNSITVSFSASYVTGNICVRAANSCGQGANFCRSVAYFSARPGTPVAITGVSSGACAPDTRTYSVAPVANTTSYNWTAPANATITGGQGTTSVTVQFLPGFTTGNLSVTASNCVGASTARTLALSNATGVPASISGPVAGVCGGSTQTYSCPLVNGASVYTWTVPANSVINSGQGTNSISVTFPTPFNSGTISVRSGTACFTSGNRSVTVNSVPASPASITGLINGVCNGSVQTYSCPLVTGATVYTWTVPANAVINSGQGSNSISVTMPASYSSGTISVVAGNACGNSTVRAVTVRSVPATPGTISGPSANLCGGGTFSYSIAAVAGSTGYTWTPAAGCSILTNTGTSITLSVPAGFTTGTLSVVASNGCGNSPARTLSLSRLPSTPGTITGPTAVCPLQSGLAYSIVPTAGLTYTWTMPGSGSIQSGQGTQAISATWGTTAGSVVVRANNACGASGNRTLAVAITACRPAVDQSAEPSLSLYPNPGNGLYFLETQNLTGKLTVKVYNMVGSMVAEFMEEDATSLRELNLLNQLSGVYLVKFESDSFRKEWKVIKN